MAILVGWTLVSLIAASYVAPVLCYPGLTPSPALEGRKFAEKPNALKKVALDNDLDDVSTNQISDGFSWTNMLGMVMQMLFNPQQGPNKSDSIDTDQGILAAVLSAVLGSKDPDQVATMAKQAGEFINIVVNLLDALKTSFSHRSMAARSLGKKDSVSEAALAGLSLLKICNKLHLGEVKCDPIRDLLRSRSTRSQRRGLSSALLVLQRGKTLRRGLDGDASMEGWRWLEISVQQSTQEQPKEEEQGEDV
ncbi:hypothetical protein C0J52_13636 [Blattella germanica]|nr:hypothetical protein C0J52_13636 [Blattella germanica]